MVLRRRWRQGLHFRCTDITKFSAFETGADGLAYESGIDEFIGSVDDMPQPTIAVVDGWAVGGGLNIVCGCDFRIATPDANFGSPLGRTIGNCLSAKSYARIASIVGIPAAKRMLLLGEFLTAPELLASGAIYSMVERADLDAAAEALVQKAMENAPLTTKASKESMRRIVYAGLPGRRRRFGPRKSMAATISSLASAPFWKRRRSSRNGPAAKPAVTPGRPAF